MVPWRAPAAGYAYAWDMATGPSYSAIVAMPVNGQLVLLGEFLETFHNEVLDQMIDRSAELLGAFHVEHRQRART